MHYVLTVMRSFQLGKQFVSSRWRWGSAMLKRFLGFGGPAARSMRLGLKRELQMAGDIRQTLVACPQPGWASKRHRRDQVYVELTDAAGPTSFIDSAAANGAAESA